MARMVPEWRAHCALCYSNKQPGTKDEQEGRRFPLALAETDHQLLTRSERSLMPKVIPTAEFFRRNIVGSGDLPQGIASFHPVVQGRGRGSGGAPTSLTATFGGLSNLLYCLP